MWGHLTYFSLSLGNCRTKEALCFSPNCTFGLTSRITFPFEDQIRSCIHCLSTPKEVYALLSFRKLPLAKQGAVNIFLLPQNGHIFASCKTSEFFEKSPFL